MSCTDLHKRPYLALKDLAKISIKCELSKITKNIEKLTVAPDTQVIKATHRLGLIDDNELNRSDIQEIAINRWNELVKNTKYKPIDIHTPLWLWSRNGFRTLI